MPRGSVGVTWKQAAGLMLAALLAACGPFGPVPTSPKAPPPPAPAQPAWPPLPLQKPRGWRVTPVPKARPSTLAPAGPDTGEAPVSVPSAVPGAPPGAPSGTGEGSAPVLVLPPHPTIASLTGLGNDQVTALLGPPSAENEKPPAKVWRYQAAGCTLDLYFYLDVGSNRFQVLQVRSDAMPTSTAAAEQCFESLIDERHAP